LSTLVGDELLRRQDRLHSKTLRTRRSDQSCRTSSRAGSSLTS
jgi:hypothetical protein